MYIQTLSGIIFISIIHTYFTVLLNFSKFAQEVIYNINDWRHTYIVISLFSNRNFTKHDCMFRTWLLKPDVDDFFYVVDDAFY